MQIIEAAYFSAAAQLSMGKAGIADEGNYLLFERMVTCVENGELFNPIESGGLSDDLSYFYGGIVRANLVDLAHYMQSKVE